MGCTAVRGGPGGLGDGHTKNCRGQVLPAFEYTYSRTFACMAASLARARDSDEHVVWQGAE